MREKLLKEIETRGDLPPLPEIVHRLRKMIEDPNSGAQDVARVVQSDPVLAGRLLQLANSVYWRGGSVEVTRLTKALSRLGLKMALDLAYSMELPKLFQREQLIKQADFWKYSLGLAIVAQSLSKRLKANRNEQSNAYLGGLMRNTGVLVFAHLMPKEYGELIAKVSEEKGVLEDAETQAFGISRAEIGACFVERWWPVSPDVLSAVRERPTRIKVELANVVPMASCFLNWAGMPDGTGAQERRLPPRYMQLRFGFTQKDCEQLRDEVDIGVAILS